ncbi:MAG: glycosyltransferase family 1 protein [Bacteroidota bacterium]
MAHIAVNTRLLLSHRLEGISRFGYEVLKRMVAENPNTKFSFFFDRAYDPTFVFGDNVTAYHLPPQARHPVLWHMWFHWQVPRKLRQLQADVFFSPEFYLSSDIGIPQIPVFHDLAYEHYPKDIAPWASRYCRKYSPIYARRAAHLLTVSEFSKQDISDRYGIARDRISVVHNGASRTFQPLPTAQQQAVRDQYSGGKPYFHFVGTLHPRKNIEHLLLAFDRFRDRIDTSVQLLLIGRKGWQYEGALRTYQAMKYKEDVHFTGFVSDEDLNRLYAASLGLCYIPYLEGFGIPLLEAMQSEIPIICSKLTAMPEVAGKAALLVDPFSLEEISESMLRLYHEPALRQQLIEEGRIQRTQFSWDKTYQRVWRVLKRYV